MFENVKIRGLMTMPPPYFSEDELKRTFSAFNELYMKEKEKDYGKTVSFDTLSMGMSNDYPLALKEGATIIRIGTALFGQRI